MQRIQDILRLASDWLVDRTSLAPVAAPEVSATQRSTTFHEKGDLVRAGQTIVLRRHVPENRKAFQRWYADEEIAYLLRHDLAPLDSFQSQRYFDSIILPQSARGHCFAIHERSTDRLIGTTALTDMSGPLSESAYFRIVIGEKEVWNRGYGTEATRLVMAEGFERMGLQTIKLEVFRHNPRAVTAYERVGFEKSGEHTEWVGSRQMDLVVDEMTLHRDQFERETSSEFVDKLADCPILYD